MIVPNSVIMSPNISATEIVNGRCARPMGRQTFRLPIT